MPKVYSFDIFDTVFIRNVALATDVFRTIGEALALRHPQVSSPGSFVEDFVSARILAESRARTTLGTREDCTIHEIWDELARLLPAVVRPQDFALELRSDEAALIVNPTIAARIRNHRSRGERVIFISDIYYPHETVYRWLAQAGLCHSPQDVYVSSEIGLLKHSGNLFRHVLGKEGIQASDLHHIGDNTISDMIRPSKLGISAEHYPDSRLTPAEQIVQEAGRPGLFGSRLAATMRVARLQVGACHRGDEVTTFLGPLAVLTALWTAALARESGVTRIYFVARDGYVPWRAATQMNASMEGLDIRYIRLSRSSLIAAMPRLGDFGAFWIKQSWAGLKAGEIVERLGYAWPDIADALAAEAPDLRPESLLADDASIAAVVAAIDSAALPDARRSELEQRRASVVGYLRQEGMFDGTPFIIFDVGWFLNLQAAFKSILDAQGASGFAGGAYLALSLGRVADAMAGPASAMFYERPYCLDRPADANFVFDRRILVEHLLGLAPHGSAMGYAATGDGGFVATEGPIAPLRQEVVQNVSDRIAAFAAIADAAIRSGEDRAALVRLADRLLGYFVENAHRHDLGSLSQLHSESDGRQAHPFTIPEPWSVSTALLQLVPYRLRERWQLGHGPTLWPEMALARARGAARFAYGLVRALRRSGRWLLKTAR